jgi:hypothetical protein
VTPEGFLLQRFTGCSFLTNGVMNKRRLEAVHDVEHPLFAWDREIGTMGREFPTKVFAEGYWITFGSAMVSGLETAGVESTAVEWGLGAHGVC